MKKALKFLRIVGIVVILLVITVHGVARYGWKLFDFDLCEDPETFVIFSVDVKDDSVRISGETINSATAYVGRTYEVRDGILYVGIKQNLLFGFLNRIGAYDFTISGDFSNLQAIYLRDQTEERCIWQSKEYAAKRIGAIQSLKLYPTVFTDSSLDYAETICDAEFVLADAELLQRVQNALYDSQDILSKGQYLGVAELQNGEKLYLRMQQQYDCFCIVGEKGHFNY